MPPNRRRISGRVSGENVVIEVAWMYYQEGLNQKDIAERLGISRATVVNHLQAARERGLIRITLNSEAFTTHRLARDLCAKFGLDAAFVAPDEGAGTVATFFRVVRAAADWLPELLAPGDRLGVAWGRTIYELAGIIADHRIEDVEVLQLIGSMATPYGFTAEACSTRLAQRLGAACHNLHAPAILTSARLAGALRAEPLIRAQLSRLASVNKLLFSVGTCLPDSHIVGSGVATLEELAWYVDHGAQAVLCGRFIDAEGRAIDGPLEPRMIGIDLDRLVGLPMGLLITPGLDKVAATRAAIRGGYVSHLVTALSVAEVLLAED